MQPRRLRFLEKRTSSRVWDPRWMVHGTTSMLFTTLITHDILPNAIVLTMGRFVHRIVCCRSITRPWTQSLPLLPNSRREYICVQWKTNLVSGECRRGAGAGPALIRGENGQQSSLGLAVHRGDGPCVARLERVNAVIGRSLSYLGKSRQHTIPSRLHSQSIADVNSSALAATPQSFLLSLQFAMSGSVRPVHGSGHGFLICPISVNKCCGCCARQVLMLVPGTLVETV